MNKILFRVIRDFLVFLSIFIAIGVLLLFVYLKKQEKSIRPEIEYSPKNIDLDQDERGEKENYDAYSRCLNEAYSKYKEEFELQCRQKIDNNCVLPPETLEDIQQKYIDKKADCKKLIK
ncbi:hypothetical protein GF382_02080 [Candidatus Falkowbacteria bacterium]|nr:hypothetical protein [Candidatus Falkowbacteria bacterium]